MVGFLVFALAVSAPPTYQPHDAIVVQHQPTSPDNRLVMAEMETSGDDGKVFLLVLFVAAGLLLTVLSIPMVFRKVPPNPLYGFRVKATLENEDVWYAANEYAGKRLFWVGIGTVVSACVLFLMPITNVGVYASAVGGIVLVGLVVTLVQSFLHLRTLSPKK